MIERADVVVIGSGGLGAATAFYLAQRGAGRVVLLDKHDLGSQTSPRAAGMAAHARISDLMIELMKIASAKLKRFTEDTGQPLAWTQSGSLKVARRHQLPALRAVTVREHRGCLPTMTADGRHIVGPAPSARGFFIAGGCNVAGLSISPAIGDALAAWIVDGAPPLDLTPLSLERFGPEPPFEEKLRRDAVWQYRHFYGSA